MRVAQSLNVKSHFYFYYSNSRSVSSYRADYRLRPVPSSLGIRRRICFRGNILRGDRNDIQRIRDRDERLIINHSMVFIGFPGTARLAASSAHAFVDLEIRGTPGRKDPGHEPGGERTWRRLGIENRSVPSLLNFVRNRWSVCTRKYRYLSEFIQ